MYRNTMRRSYSRGGTAVLFNYLRRRLGIPYVQLGVPREQMAFAVSYRPLPLRHISSIDRNRVVLYPELVR